MYEIACQGTLNIQEMYFVKYRPVRSSASKAFNTIQGEDRVEVCWSNKSVESCKAAVSLADKTLVTSL